MMKRLLAVEEDILINPIGEKCISGALFEISSERAKKDIISERRC
jgi:hypothetical protein